MKYTAPKNIAAEDILAILKNSNTSPSDRISAVLSAVYFCENFRFSGDLLIQEFSTAKYEEKIYLMNLFETFYGVTQSSYRIEDSISLMEKYKSDSQENIGKINEIITSLKEYKSIFPL